MESASVLLPPVLSRSSKSCPEAYVPGTRQWNAFAALGHRDIALLRAPKRLGDSPLPWKGIRRFAADAGLASKPALILSHLAHHSLSASPLTIPGAPFQPPPRLTLLSKLKTANFQRITSSPPHLLPTPFFPCPSFACKLFLSILLPFVSVTRANTKITWLQHYRNLGQATLDPV